jgi:uncharacterized membrane protein YqgA involved in biofilm formation
MKGFGTVINVVFIVIGGVLGTLFGNRLPERYQDTVMKANGVAVLFIGIGGAMSQMLKISGMSLETQGTMMMTVSLSLGAIIGEILRIDYRLEQFGEWLKQKTGNAKEAGFVDSFVTATMTVCIGAMAVIGSIEDGIYGNYSILLAKAILDLVIILIMSASLGKGCVFSAIPVGIFQGSITLCAGFLAPVITEAAMAYLSFVGSILIFCVGVNLLWEKKIKVTNLLPALVIAVAWSYF